MSIEKTLAELTEALNNHTAALTAFVKSSKGGTTAGASASTKADTKAETTASKPRKPKGITLEAVQEKFGGYLKVADKEERAARLANVVAINKHFGVAKMTEADPSIWPEAFEILDRVIAGEDVDDVLGGGDEGDEDDGGSVV